MSTPPDKLTLINNSISRWNEIRDYTNLQKLLQESPPHRDPFFGERYSKDHGSSSNYSSLQSIDANCSDYGQRKTELQEELLRTEASNILISTALNSTKNISPNNKSDRYDWNSSIDHHHTYYPHNEIQSDPYELNEYIVSHADLNSSPISNEQSICARVNSHGIISHHTPPSEFTGSYTTCLSPMSGVSEHNSAERLKIDGFEDRLQYEDLPKEHNERRKRRKTSKQEADEKICGICGDNAKSLHFGGMACDSCKAFFRRSVQTKSYHSFKCTEKSCEISKNSRKNCQYCRFQKCLHIGMEIRWVMSESERMELWKAKLARHREVKSISRDVPHYNNPLSPISINKASILSNKDAETIKDLTILQEVIFSSSRYPTTCNNSEELSNLFFCICQKLQKFFFRTEEFQSLSGEDQGLAMKGGIAKSIYIHGAYLYDVVNNIWPSAENKSYLKVPTITNSLLRQFTVLPEVYDALMTFYRKYGCNIKDESVLALLCLIALFFDSSGIKCEEQIRIHRNYFIHLLKQYLIDKLGPISGENQFSHLMSSYEYLKKIVAYHNKVAIEPNFQPTNMVSVDQCNVTFDVQMNAIIEGLRQSRISGLPEFASVFGPSKNDDKRLRRVENKAAYAWLTSVIFGYETKADRLLSFFPPEILVQKRPFGIVNQKEDISQSQ